jgi:hypothetical protein
MAQNKQQGARTTSNPTVGGNGSGLFASNAAAQQGPPGIAHYLQSGPSGVHNAAPSPYVRPNPFDLTQQQQPHGAHPAVPPGLPAHGHGHHGHTGIPGAGDTHILSPNARALQAHAPGQSLPQGLAAGYSRIHALPPLPPTAGSPSPAAFGTSPNTGGGYNASRDWATMSTGSISGSPGFMSFMNQPAPANAAAAAAAAAPPKGVVASPPVGGAGLDAMFSQRSYSAATRTGGASGVPTVAAPMQRNASGGAKWQGGAPMSPLGGAAVTAGAADDGDDLFRLDD